MKSVLISIQPRWCELIASSKKTIEVRKTRPKIDVPFKCYIYCTNWKDNTYWKNHYKDKLGKVIGEFVCDKIYDIEANYDIPTFCNQYVCDWLEVKDDACLSFFEFDEYLKGKSGYGWHISDLVIYDKPKELSDFRKPCNHKNDCCTCDRYDYIGHKCYDEITRPFQSWGYVEESENNKNG